MVEVKKVIDMRSDTIYKSCPGTYGNWTTENCLPL